MSTEIYYFSGSGNSLFVSRELQKRIPAAELVPIAGLLGRDVIKTSGETVGFVFPTHGMISPIPVRMFLEKVDLGSAEYLFAIATRGGTKFLGFPKIEKKIAKQGKKLDSRFVLNMADNDPKFEVYEVPTEEKIALLESEARVRLDSIAKTIVNRETSREEDSGYLVPSNWFLERLVVLGMWYAQLSGVNDYFYSDSKCKGCRTCEKVCLSGKIEITDKKPAWRNDIKCYMCYACLNYCPSQAVQIKDKWFMKSYTAKNGRYSHPYATVDDIAGQERRSAPAIGPERPSIS